MQALGPGKSTQPCGSVSFDAQMRPVNNNRALFLVIRTSVIQSIC